MKADKNKLIVELVQKEELKKDSFYLPSASEILPIEVKIISAGDNIHTGSNNEYLEGKKVLLDGNSTGIKIVVKNKTYYVYRRDQILVIL